MSEEKKTTDKPDTTFDPREYLSYFDDSDLSEEAKIEYIEFLWLVASEFAAIGFGTHPVQQAKAPLPPDKAKDAAAIRKSIAAFMEEEGKGGGD